MTEKTDVFEPMAVPDAATAGKTTAAGASIRAGASTIAERQNAIASIEVPLCVNDEILARPGMLLGWDSVRAARYCEAVVAEIEANAGQFDDCLVRAVRFGGGVATNAGRGIADIMAALKRSVPVADDAQVTMEASVANISGATFPFFRRAGIHRFDFEMFSLNSANFTRLNTVDNLADYPLVCDHFLHAYGNRSLGLVLAYGYEPRAREDAVIECRRSALAVGENAAHVRLEPVRGARACGADEAARQRCAMAEALESQGFAEYLPGRFARPGEEDRFAMMDAAGAPRLGFGLGALTRLDGAESRTTTDFERYVAHSGNFALITEKARPIG